MATHHRFDCAVTAYLEGELDTREVVELLREAAALAKRYEDAPVAKAAYYYRPTMGAATGIMFEGPDFTPLTGQRVRIVLDKEG